MRTLVSRALVGVCIFTGLVHAAPNGATTAPYQRLICVVPLIGSGTLEDPKRPMFAPGRGALSSAPGLKAVGFLEGARITGFRSTLADDGVSAIVEFTANQRSALPSSTQAKAANVKIYDRDRMAPQDLETELRKIKKNFRLAQLEGSVR